MKVAQILLNSQVKYLTYLFLNSNHLLIFLIESINFTSNRSIMENLIQPPPISQQILSRLTQNLTIRYELKDTLILDQFNEDATKTIEQFQLYSTTIQQLNSSINSNANHLMKKFTLNMFKIMRFMVKLINKLVTHSNHKENGKNYKIQQFCVNCLDSLQQKNIKSLQKELYQYALPNYDPKEWDSSHLDSEVTQNDEPYTTEEQLTKKMTKLQRSLADRQLNLMRCIEQFQQFRSNLLIGVKAREQDKGGIDVFDYKDYTFKLSIHFVNELNKIQEKINNLKKSVRKVEDSAIQTVAEETNELESTKKGINQNFRSINFRADSEFKKYNQMRGRMEESLKKYQLETRQMAVKVQMLEERNKLLKEEVYSLSMKDHPKPRNRIHPSQIQATRLRYEQQRSKDRLSLDINGNIDEGSLINQFSNRVFQRLAQLQSNKIQEVFPMLKATFKKTMDTLINQRLSSTIDRKKIMKFDSNEEQPHQERRKSHKKSMRLHLDPDLIKQMSRFAPKRKDDIEMSIVNQFSVKINNHVGKKSIYQEQKLNQNQKLEYRLSKKGLKYKKSILQTEGNAKKKISHTKLNSLLSLQYKQSKQNDKMVSQPLLINKRSSLYFNEDNSLVHTVQNPINQMQHSQFKKIFHKQNMKRNRSQDEILIQRMSNNENIGQNMKGLLQVSRLECRIMEQKVIDNLLLINEERIATQSNIQKYDRIRTGTKQLKSLFSQTSFTAKQSKNRKQRHLQTEKPILKPEQINFLTTFFTMMAKAHLTNPLLYNQLKQILVGKYQQSENNQKTNNQTMMKQALAEIILRHRKCQNKELCHHLIQFMEAFQQCMID